MCLKNWATILFFLDLESLVTRIERFQNWAIAYIAIWAISPPLFASDTARALVLIATGAWFFLELSRSKGIVLRPTRPVILAFVFMAYTGVLEVVLNGPNGLLSHIQIWIMLLFLVIFQSRRTNLQSLTPIFWLVLSILPLWMFITIKTVLFENPHAARLIVRSSAEADTLVQQGVGGYALVYGAILLLPSLSVLLLNSFSLKNVILPRPLQSIPAIAQGLLLVNLALSVFLVLSAGFSIAVIAMIAIFILTIFLNRYSAQRAFITLFALVVAFVLGESLLEWVLTAMLPFAEGTNFAIKINDVLRSMQVGDAVGSAGDRLERYARSFRLFIENPIVGTLVVDDIGKHSEVVDTYARWGAFIGTIFLYLTIFLPLRVLQAGKIRFGVGLAMLMAVVFVLGLNSGFAVAGLMLFLMFPVVSHMLKGLERNPIIWSERRVRA